MSTERREQERLSINTAATITLRHTEEEAEVMESVAANISSGGAYLTTDREIPLAAKVKVEFFLELDELRRLKFVLSEESLRQLQEGNQLWVVTQGIVIRKDQQGVAVIFDTDYLFTPMQPRPAAPGAQ
jgi:c-di-GMP-binding flagellar brake protein YcgR